MRYHVLTTDYDGTLATNDHVSPEILQSLIRFKATGRKLILVTGRELDELKAIFPEHTIFDRIVAENGAVLYRPATLEIVLLGERPPETFIRLLASKNVPVSEGRVIVASWEPHQAAILEAIKQTGLEYQVIFNKGAVMVLPPGINKATGLHEALKELDISEHNITAIGDAENDNAMLLAAECAVAVNNALPQVIAIADWTTDSPFGGGVTQLIDQIIKDDLVDLDKHLLRHYLELGQEMDGSSFKISPYGNNILLAGTSGFGKTTLSAAFLEKLMAKQYQFCLIDPEGDYQEMPGVLTIGDCGQAPMISQVIKLLTQAGENVVVNMLGIPLGDRPVFFRKLLNAVIELRRSTGHPHFIIMDEAHHLMPKENPESFYDFPADFNSFLAITTKPDLICHDFLKRINLVMTMGESPGQSMHEFAGIIKAEIAIPVNLTFRIGDVMVWQKGNNGPRLVKSDMPNQLLMRHKRKYAAGDMGSNSFYFNGFAHKLNLKANNLMVFIQMADGVDDETWLYHLRRHDYSNWFRNSVKDEKLATYSENIENKERNANSSRRAIFKAILERYTAPA